MFIYIQDILFDNIFYLHKFKKKNEYNHFNQLDLLITSNHSKLENINYIQKIQK